MQWLTLASTLLGALIGIGSTLIVDRMRWSREKSKARYETRRQLYSEFLADLSTTREIIRTVARGYHSAEIPRRQAAIEGFRSANLYSRRHQLSITAPPAIVAAATETFDRLRTMRDVVGGGHGNDSDLYIATKVEYDKEREHLISLMRTDLDQAL